MSALFPKNAHTSSKVVSRQLGVAVGALMLLSSILQYLTLHCATSCVKYSVQCTRATEVAVITHAQKRHLARVVCVVWKYSCESWIALVLSFYLISMSP